MRLDLEKYRILRDLDVEAVRADFIAAVGEPLKPDAIEASLHKARIYAGRTFPHKLREQSAVWLREHGYEVPNV